MSLRASSRLFLGLALFIPWAGTAEVLEGQVLHRKGHYLVHFDILIHAPLKRVLPLVRDYANLPRISPCIRSVEVLTPAGRTPAIMRLKSRFCVLFVCKDIRYLQEVEEHPPGHIFARVLPGEGDLRFGYTSYRFSPLDGETRLRLEADIVPAFWVPPWIGPLLIRRALAKEAETTARRIEALAHGP